MPTFQITVYATDPNRESLALMDVFEATGCTDATLSWQGGRYVFDFDRTAPTFAVALKTVVEDVAATGAQILSIDLGDEPDALLDLVRDYALNRIRNGRTVTDVIDHLESEVDEVRTEIAVKDAGEPAGADGIRGESVDITICGIDAVFVDDATVTNAQILETAREKCEKWERHYAHSLTRER